MKKPKFPKKAKLITDGGFYKIIKISRFDARILVPLSRKIELKMPEIGAYSTDVFLDIEFLFDRVYRGYAEYRQYNVYSVKK